MLANSSQSSGEHELSRHPLKGLVTIAIPPDLRICDWLVADPLIYVGS